jgi:hypothetical protein
MDSNCASDASSRPRAGAAQEETLLRGAILAALALAFVLKEEWLDASPALCLTKRMAGIPCPGCGLTHSWVAAAHGEFAQSLAANPFGLLLMLAASAWLLLRTLRVQPRAWQIRCARPVGFAFLAAFVGFGLFRALGTVIHF